MQFRFAMPVLVATLAFSGAAVLQTEVQAKPGRSQNQSTVFRCVRSGRAFATIAQRGSRVSAPMITWERDISAEYTAEARCKSVSQKLTKAVAQNGGSLRNLLLTSGRVNGETVICYVNTGSSCNKSNTLFTLKRENAQDPGAVLAGLLRFGTGASSGPVRESASGGDDEESTADNVDMEAAVEQAFTAGTHESAGGDSGDSAVPPAPAESVNNNENSLEVNPSNAPDSQTDSNQGNF